MARRLRDASFLAVTALMAVAVAGGVLATDRVIEASAQQVTIHATAARFEPAEVRVRAGEWVSMHLVNDDRVFHDLMVEGVENVDIPARPGQTSSIRFIIDKPGTYMFSSSVPGQSEAGMAGTLIVE